MADRSDQRRQKQSEIDAFLSDCCGRSLFNDKLKEHYLGDITEDTLHNGTITERRRVQNFLKHDGAPCGRDSRNSILSRLILLLRSKEVQTKPILRGLSGNSSLSSAQSGSDSSSKRNFLKIARYKEEKYAGPYESSLFESVHLRFEQYCQALDIPEIHKLELIYTMFIGETLRFLTMSILPNVSTYEEAFDKLQ